MKKDNKNWLSRDNNGLIALILLCGVGLSLIQGNDTSFFWALAVIGVIVWKK